MATELQVKMTPGDCSDVVAVLDCQAWFYLSDMYQCQIVIKSKALLDLAACRKQFDGLAFALQGQQRVIRGEVTQVSLCQRDVQQYYHYKLKLEPAVQQLQQRIHSRVFQSIRMKKLLQELLADTCAFDLRGLQDNKLLIGVIQYQESDWQFLKRICAAQGILFFWTWSPQWCLHFSHSTRAWQRVELGHVKSDVISKVQISTAETYSAHYYNPEERTSCQRIGAANADIDLGLCLSVTQVECKRMLRLQAQRQAQLREQLLLQSREQVLLPGQYLDLGKTPYYAIARTQLALNQEEGFYCQSRAVAFTDELVPLQASKPPRLPLTQATVVGPKPGSVHADAQGRIKLRYHWDELHSHHESIVQRVRIVSPWQGKPALTQFIPRVGDEVVVSFLHDDLNHPIVIGSLMTAAQLPQVFAKPTQAGIAVANGEVYQHLLFDTDKHRLNLSSSHTIDIDAKQTLALTSQHKADIQIDEGDLQLQVKQGECVISAKQKISFTVGDTELTLTPGAIVLSANQIHLN